MLDPAFLTRPLAHRGLHDAACGVPENSLPAIRAAIAAGYGIELDVQLSADGAAMVFHDATLDRMTAATGPVSAQTAAALGALTLTGSDAAIPTLTAVLDAIDGRVPVLIELKDQSGGLGPAAPDLERAVATAVADYPGPVAVMSFNPAMIATMQTLAPGCARGLVTCAFDTSEFPDLPPDIATLLRDIAAFDAVGASFISHDWRDLARPRVGALKRQGVPILCWTVKSAADYRIARRVADTVTFEGYRPPI